VADLHHRRFELTRASVREATLAGELDPFRAIVEELASELDPLDVAAAAVKLVHEAAHAASRGEEQDIEIVPPPARERPERGAKPAWGKRGRERREPRGGPAASFETTRIFIGAGRLDSMRPGDLVGAIANEAGLAGNEIGSIRITDRFSLVEVPAERAEDVIRALRGTTLRGKRVTVRRDLHS
jgi:ATP-dependent RNA helicase DeaD